MIISRILSRGWLFFLPRMNLLGTRMDMDESGFAMRMGMFLNTNRSNITNLPCGWVFYSPTDCTDEHRYSLQKQ